MTSPSRRGPRRKPRSRSSFPYAASFWSTALVLWSLALFREWPAGDPGAWAAWAKGAALLTAAAAAYASLTRGLWTKGRSLLGLFPLAWLALSHPQWDLCAHSTVSAWLAVTLFLGWAAWTGWRREGKPLLLGAALFWTALDALWPRALFLPLAFLPFRRGLFREARWARWGSLAAFLLLSAATRVWLHFQWNGLEFYDWFLGKHFAVFGVFVLLGWAAFPVRGTQRSVPLAVGLLALGFLLLAAAPVGRTPGPAGLGWLLIWGAGFGFESLRRDLLDASWHGRAVWAAAGLAAFGGVF